MNVDAHLTVVLPLKDRLPFTRRWMTYADRFRFPFTVIVADGGTDDGAQRLLADRRAFPHVDYKYIRYPPDRIYGRDYWAKLADALRHVQTPFVALAHDDDLFVIDGVRQAVRFLLDHPDYATCGGQSAVFWVTGATGGDDAPCYGSRVDWKYSRERSVEHPTAGERIRHLSLRAAHPGEHHVRRTDDFRQQVDTIRQAGLHDVFLIERLFLWLAAIAGKARQLRSLYIARQWNVPRSAGLVHEAEHGDWFGRLLAPTWSQDFTTFVDLTSVALAAKDGLPLEDARRAVAELYRFWLAPQLAGDLLAEPTVTMPMPIAIRMAQRLLSRSPDSVIRRVARRLYRRSRWISVDARYGTQFRARPVADAERAFRPVFEFLATRPASDLPSQP